MAAGQALSRDPPPSHSLAVLPHEGLPLVVDERLSLFDKCGVRTMKSTNETVQIEVSSPLLRPGLKLIVRTSKRYAVDAASDLIELARAINAASAK